MSLKNRIFTLLAVCTMPILLSSCLTTEQRVSRTVKSTVPQGKVNQSILSQSNRYNTRVIIDIEDQKAFLLVNGTIAIESPVSTARPGKYTPRGTFSMTERVRSGKVSTIYDVSMPFWMRLDGSVFGVHAGYLPGYPASAGCIRLPYGMAEQIYNHSAYGTKVSIYNSWSGG